MAAVGVRVTPFATQMGMSRQQASNLRRGTSLPPLTKVPALALVLGVPEERVRARIIAARTARTAARTASGTPTAGRSS